jgi:porin
LWASGPRSLNAFGRIMGAPDNQNYVDFSFNGGLSLAAPFPGRENDTAGIDLGIGRVSGRTAEADRDAGVTAQGTEELIELTYQAQVTPWLIVQPDMQYIVNPGGGVQDRDDATHNLRNEFVAGARVIVTF